MSCIDCVTKETVKESKALRIFGSRPCLLFLRSGSTSSVVFLIRDGMSPPTWRKAPVMSHAVDLNCSLLQFLGFFLRLLGNKGERAQQSVFVGQSHRALEQTHYSDGWKEGWM